MSSILLTGSHGFIGNALQAHLRTGGHTVLPLSRHVNQPHHWQPDDQQMSPLPSVDAIIHLAGAGIATKRWTPSYKQYLQLNRRNMLLTLTHAIQQAKTPPKTLIVASAVSYCGIHQPQPITEAAPHGTGFAAELCHTIEHTLPLFPHTRVVYARVGIALAPHGGPLGKMLPPFKWGLGGTFGNGQQPFPWISLTDTLRAIEHLLNTPALHGPVNLAAPAQDTNATFTHALGQALHRPTLFPMPAPVIRLLFGQMGEEILLHGVAAVPEKLQQTGFIFQHPTLQDFFTAYPLK